MNAGIVILQDGTPCIAYDEALPLPIRHVEFNRDDFCVTLVFDTPGRINRQGKKFDFPLDHRFVELLEERGNVAVAQIKGKQVVDIKSYSLANPSKLWCVIQLLTPNKVKLLLPAGQLQLVG